MIENESQNLTIWWKIFDIRIWQLERYLMTCEASQSGLKLWLQQGKISILHFQPTTSHFFLTLQIIWQQNHISWVHIGTTYINDDDWMTTPGHISERDYTALLEKNGFKVISSWWQQWWQWWWQWLPWQSKWQLLVAYLAKILSWG